MHALDIGHEQDEIKLHCATFEYIYYTMCVLHYIIRWPMLMFK